MIKVEYHMLDGKYINGNSLDVNCREGDFIAIRNSESENAPEGMFRISRINKERLVLEQINCNFINWKGNFRKMINIPDENCRLKCQYLDKCPVRDYLLLLKSGFE